MTDLIATWKEKKFLIAGTESNAVVILTNLNFWIVNEQALDYWCEQHGATVKGMIVTLPDAQTLTAFTLRWS